MAKRDRSPCIDVCRYSGPNGWCEGCGRTRLESKNWKAMKPNARRTLLRELKKRLSRMAARSPD